MQGLVRYIAHDAQSVLQRLDGVRPARPPGYRLTCLDGNCLTASEHRHSFFIIRQHGSLTTKPLEMMRRVSTCETGEVHEQAVQLRSPEGTWWTLRRITVSFSGDDGLRRCSGESASTMAFRDLLSVHSRCGPQRPPTSFEAFSTGASAHSLPPGPPLALPAGVRVGRGDLSPAD